MFKRTLLAAALAAAATTAFADPVSYDLDPAHTNVVASWNPLGFSNPILHFGDAEGTLVFDAEDVGASSVTVTLPVAGLQGFTDAFNQHLLSAELFDAARYPEITFTSTAVEAAGEGKLEIAGDLTTQLKEMRHYSKNNVELLTAQWLRFDEGKLKKLGESKTIEDLMTRQGEFHDALEAAIAELDELAEELKPKSEDG